jgi:hypothetical protein
MMLPQPAQIFARIPVPTGNIGRKNRVNQGRVRDITNCVFALHTGQSKSPECSIEDLPRQPKMIICCYRLIVEHLSSNVHDFHYTKTKPQKANSTACNHTKKAESTQVFASEQM